MIDERAGLPVRGPDTDLGAKLDGGPVHRCAGNLTPAQVVDGLVDNRIVVDDGRVTFREGLRLEQIDRQARRRSTTSAIDPEEFYKLATHPTDALLGDYPWLLEERPPEGRVARGLPLSGHVRPSASTPTTRRPPRTWSG